MVYLILVPLYLGSEFHSTWLVSQLRFILDLLFLLGSNSIFCRAFVAKELEATVGRKISLLPSIPAVVALDSLITFSLVFSTVFLLGSNSSFATYWNPVYLIFFRIFFSLLTRTLLVLLNLSNQLCVYLNRTCSLWAEKSLWFLENTLNLFRHFGDKWIFLHSIFL